METLSRQRLLRWAASSSIAAGLIHGLNVEEHLNEWWGYGLFFLFAAAGQVVYGLVLLVRPWEYDDTGARRMSASLGRPIYLAGIWANAFFVVLYLVTRTVGIPLLGPAAGEVEPFSVLGVLTKIAESAIVVSLVLVLRRRPGTARAGP